MARSSTFDLFDRILEGKLPSLLEQWRADGVSVTDMSFKLREYDVKVAPETVRRWLKRMDDTEAVA